MADNLEGRNQDFDDQPIYDDDTRAYESDPPDQNYVLDEIETVEATERGLSWLLVGLIALAAVVVGLLIYYFLFNNGGGGTIIGPVQTPIPGDDSWNHVRSSGRLVVGTSLDYPPFAYRNAQFQPDGFDIALISDIANGLSWARKSRIWLSIAWATRSTTGKSMSPSPPSA